MDFKKYLGLKVKIKLIDNTINIGFLFFGKKYSGFARRFILIPIDLEGCTVVFCKSQIDSIEIMNDLEGGDDE